MVSMEMDQDDNRQPRLNFDVLRVICNFLTDVSDALSFSLTCSALRNDALQRRLRMSPIFLSDCESVDKFHRFIFADPAARAPYIYGFNLGNFYYNVESQETRHSWEETEGHLVVLLESAIRIQYLHLRTSIGDRALGAATKLATLRKLFVFGDAYDTAFLHRFLHVMWSPLRYLHVEASESEHFDAGLLHYDLAHLAPTLETLELDEFPLHLSPSAVTTPFAAMRTLKTKSISVVYHLAVLWWLFPNLDTLIVDRLDQDLTEDAYRATREGNKEAQETRSWPRLDRVVCEAGLAYLMALVCPIRRMDVTVSSSQDRQLRYLAETLRHNCPSQLRLSLSFNYGLRTRTLDGLFPSEVADSPLTHLVVFADIDVQTEGSARRHAVSWIGFMDELAHSMSHLRLTHLRVVFHYKIYDTISNSGPAYPHPKITAPHDGESFADADTRRETDLLLAAARFFDTIQTLQHVFLTHCGRTWVWEGSYTRLRNKWSCSKAWRAASVHNSSGPKRGLCTEISCEEAEAVMNREDLQLSRREEDKSHKCGERPDPTARFPIQEAEEPLEEWAVEGRAEARKKASDAKGNLNGTASDEGWVLVDTVAAPGHEMNSTAACPPPENAIEPSRPPKIHTVAHSKEAQQLFDTIPLSWGVQYEIARGVSQGLWTWEAVVQSEPALRSLSGPNANASRVSQVLGHSPGDPLPSDDPMWSELDREDAAIIEGSGRGLGLDGDFMGQSNWYGGRVQQTATLREAGDGFRLVLAKMEMGKSTRFARFLGSRRTLQVSIPHNVVSKRADELRAFFAQKFVLCGRVFVAFCVKGAKVFLMEVPEDHERAAVVRGDDQRITLMDFVAWHSPMDRNGSQLTSEWVANLDLGITTSVPVLFIPPDNVYHMRDQVASLNGPDMEPPAECIYTGGCGWMNGAALRAVASHLGLEERPTAVHGVFGGAKGLWVLHPRDRSSTPKIWIRESQVKITLDMGNPHFAHCVFELLGLSRVTPGRLSRTVILNLAHNGVPKEMFVELMKDMIEEEVKPLMQWAGPKAMLLLSKAVESLMISRGWMNYELHDQSPGATAQPRRTIHDVILDLLQAGFHPLKLEYLFEVLKKAVRLGMDNIVSYFHVSVQRSARAFIVPDPCGVLREGEIHFKSTKPFNGLGDLNPHILLGDVLIYRSQVILPSDVKKVTAVQHDALSAYTDVIVVPTLGPRPLGSYLGGGDYDGDVAVVLYDDRLVKGFRSPPLILEPAHNLINDNFDVIGPMQQAVANHLTVPLDRLAHDSDAHFQIVQKSFLSRLSSAAPIGLYHRFYEGSSYEYGYDAPETRRLAFMFKTLLGSQKTGHRVKEEVFKRDKKQFFKELPPSLQSRRSDSLQRQDSESLRFRRDQKLGEFILDYLFEMGRKMWNGQLQHFESLKPRTPVSGDEDLLEPWKKIQSQLNKSSPVGAALTLIQNHVHAHIKEWQAIARRTANRSTPWMKDKAGVVKSAQVQYDELARSFAAGPAIPLDSELASSANIEQLKASYAYTQKPRFAWSVAFQTLCEIKKGAQGPPASIPDFAGA